MTKNAFVLTRHSIDVNKRNKSSLGHFLDLLDACGYSAKIGAIQPSNTTLSKVDICFIDADYCNTNVLFNLPIIRQYPELLKVIFNAKDDSDDFQLSALKLGLAGVVNKADSLDLIVKGLQQIRDGNKWFSRKVMTKYINDTLKNNANKKQFNPVSNTVLTKREMSITEKIAEGAQNQEIADVLHISVNTVKTHVYSIFRKTECRNRVELIRWYNERTN